jgi:hypothetical protein
MATSFTTLAAPRFVAIFAFDQAAAKAARPVTFSGAFCPKFTYRVNCSQTR